MDDRATHGLDLITAYGKGHEAFMAVSKASIIGPTERALILAGWARRFAEELAAVEGCSLEQFLEKEGIAAEARSAAATDGGEQDAG
jgi:hypothetical protein